MKYFIGLFLTLIVLAATYSGAWFYAAAEINKGIDQFYYQDAPDMDIEFLGEKPVVTGFPGPPVINYTGGFKTDDVMVAFDDLKITGFPLPKFPIYFEIDSPLLIENHKLEASAYVDYLQIVAIIPAKLPNSTNKADISRWQKNVGTIEVEHFATSRRSTFVKSYGNIGLDEDLQPIFQMTSNVSGYEELINLFVESEFLKPMPASLAISALNALALNNPETGRKEVTLLSNLQNNTLYLGPVRIAELPAVEWPE